MMAKASMLLLALGLGAGVGTARQGPGTPSQAQNRIAPQLQVDVSAGHIKITAHNSTYGRALRELEHRLGVPIEAPASANQAALNDAAIDAADAESAIERLLSQSGFGYAILKNKDGSLKKVEVFSIEASGRTGEANSSPETASAAGDTPAGAGAAQSTNVPAASAASAGSSPEVSGTQAPNAAPVPVPPEMGPVPPEPQVSPLPPENAPVTSHNDSKPIILPLSDAASVVGAPPGVDPSTVGQTKTLPIPTGNKVP
jgi:hypothetical protein